MPQSSSITSWKDADILLEAIASPTGIAEFLVPLAVNRHIAPLIIWIKPLWSHQFPEGITKVTVGDTSLGEPRKVAVSSHCSYYVDDSYVADRANIDRDTASDIYLFTCAASMTRKTLLDSGLQSASSSSNFPGWILDICLDYFITINPFLSELRQLLLLDGFSDQSSYPPGGCVNSLDYGILMIQNMFGELKYRQLSDESRSVECLRAERDRGVHTIDAILSHDMKHDSVELMKDKPSCVPPIPDILREQFLSLYPIGYREQALETLRIIGQLSPKTKGAIRLAGFALLLPHHISTDEEIDDMLDQLFSFLSKLNVRDIRDQATTAGAEEMCYQTCNGVEVHSPLLPAAVTIARSADDGFTPSHLVDAIQSKVLSRVQEFINELSRRAAVDANEPLASIGGKRKLGDICDESQVDLIVHDLREDVVEKCFTMFLNRSAARVCRRPDNVVGIPS